MTNSTQTKDRAAPPLFAQLIMMLSSSALQNLGQAPGPGGEPPAVDLRGAEFMIDLLEMLERKTAGNLDAGEKRMLTEILAAVRLAFVHAAEGAAPRPEEEPEMAPEAEENPPAPADENTKDAVSTPQEKGEEPRFHKSYG